MKKKLLLIPLALLLAISLIAIGYTATQAETKPPQVIELTFAHTIPEVDVTSQALIKWGNMIEEKTGGRVKFVYYWAGSLLKAPEIFRGVQTGVADMGFYAMGVNPGLMPLNEFTRLPFLGWTSVQQAVRVYQEIYKLPMFVKEFQGLKILTFSVLPPYHIHTTKKAVRVPADVKGMKIAAEGQLLDAVKTAGGAPVEVGVADLYVSLERGVINGNVMHFTAQGAFGVLPLTPYHTILGETGISIVPVFFLMNPESWNKLPPDIQKIFEDSAPLLHKGQREFIMRGAQFFMGEAEKLGHTFVNLSPEEIRLWSDTISKPVAEKWIAEMEAKGLPAREALEKVKSVIEKYAE